MTRINDLDLSAIRHVIVTLMDISRCPRSRASIGARRSASGVRFSPAESQKPASCCESLHDRLRSWGEHIAFGHGAPTIPKREFRHLQQENRIASSLKKLGQIVACQQQSPAFWMFCQLRRCRARSRSKRADQGSLMLSQGARSAHSKELALRDVSSLSSSLALN